MSSECFKQAWEDCRAANWCEQKETILTSLSIFSLVPGRCCDFEISTLQDNSIKAEKIRTKESYGFEQDETMVLRITRKFST